MDTKQTLLNNICNIHTTKMGEERIIKNLKLNNIDIINFCINTIKSNNSKVIKKGKNFYVITKNYYMTINSSTYTIITAHKTKNK